MFQKQLNKRKKKSLRNWRTKELAKKDDETPAVSIKKKLKSLRHKTYSVASKSTCSDNNSVTSVLVNNKISSSECSSITCSTTNSIESSNNGFVQDFDKLTSIADNQTKLKSSLVPSSETQQNKPRVCNYFIVQFEHQWLLCITKFSHLKQILLTLETYTYNKTQEKRFPIRCFFLYHTVSSYIPTCIIYCTGSNIAVFSLYQSNSNTGHKANWSCRSFSKTRNLATLKKMKMVFLWV